ncbi:mRNA-degrading endonuclease [Marinithermofilum abyssi]|uniref:mRNA-degrading endonuclease n=1 Tax=Marinithermofilum abyssi TaxID=1571185 RepID=A0A8J2VMP7_9BACL|nr:type II toxin-antitoxin system PemK/MazF family toxin [Marinithermofilum abyssi]GGE29130.1 mRNA-degrading endonuclease [Marinithermofilum abyssi]
MAIPDRGDLVKLNFNPQSGHEQAGWRPAIVLSPKEFNQVTNFAVVCPITGQKKGYPFEIELPSELPIYGVILTDQVKSLDWRARRFEIVGRAPNEVVQDCLDHIHTFLS